MKIVGCDLHTRYQQIALVDQETGEFIERRLEHESGEARAFYAALSSPVRVGCRHGYLISLPLHPVNCEPQLAAENQDHDQPVKRLLQ